MFIVKDFQAAERRTFLVDVPNRLAFNITRYVVEHSLEVDAELFGEGSGAFKWVIGADIGAALWIMKLLANELLHEFLLIDEPFLFVSRFPSQPLIKAVVVLAEVDENGGAYFLQLALPNFFLGLCPGAEHEVELPFRAGAILGAVFFGNQSTQGSS